MGTEWRLSQMSWEKKGAEAEWRRDMKTEAVLRQMEKSVNSVLDSIKRSLFIFLTVKMACWLH